MWHSYTSGMSLTRFVYIWVFRWEAAPPPPSAGDGSSVGLVGVIIYGKRENSGVRKKEGALEFG